MNNKLCFILDTNVLLLSVSRRTRYKYILDRLFDGVFEIALSTEILFEYEEKLRQFYDKEISDAIIAAFNLLPNIRKVEPDFNLLLIKDDADDNKFVDCAFAANANGIVTNDKHFRVLRNTPFPRINVINIDQFMELLVQLT
jgi:putative PIN family toxin of toxin-antitoxin system